ncbi:MAG: aminotransferase class V-fold PLP-dependent enzyme [Bacteroidia bacterium]|nr:aminotransferase class V-fold PLP-dependent enzyme [Bacteroidia bacterium]
MLNCKRNKFSLPRRLTYLNCAYMSPMLKDIEKAGVKGLRSKRNPSDIAPADFFSQGERLRTAFANIVHAEDARRIVSIPSVSYGMATVAHNLKAGKGDNIVVAAEQFPSNYYTWEQLAADTGSLLKVVAPPDTLVDRGKTWNARLLEAIDHSTKAVAVGNVHWADGTRFDLPAIRKRTREVGAWLIVDGTQSVGALPFDVANIQPDALVCAAYKWLLGPYSIGLAYFGEALNNGRPLEENWINRLHSEDFQQLVNYQPAYQPGALRYEVGEHSNFIHVPMMLKALKQIEKWGVDRIQEYCRHITTESIEKLREKGFWVEDEAYRGHHLFGIRLPKSVDMESVKAQLKKKNIAVSIRGNAVRVAPYLYNDVFDVQRLVKVLTQY